VPIDAVQQQVRHRLEAGKHPQRDAARGIAADQDRKVHRHHAQVGREHQRAEVGSAAQVGGVLDRIGLALRPGERNPARHEQRGRSQIGVRMHLAQVCLVGLVEAAVMQCEEGRRRTFARLVLGDAATAAGEAFGAEPVEREHAAPRVPADDDALDPVGPQQPAQVPLQYQRGGEGGCVREQQVAAGRIHLRRQTSGCHIRRREHRDDSGVL
jgi:hypothetical protein